MGNQGSFESATPDVTRNSRSPIRRCAVSPLPPPPDTCLSRPRVAPIVSGYFFMKTTATSKTAKSGLEISAGRGDPRQARAERSSLNAPGDFGFAEAEIVVGAEGLEPPTTAL